MKGKASKLLSVFLALVMMAGLLPLPAQAEERTKVTNIVATSNTSSIAIYGSEIRVPTFNITTGAEARFATANGGWLKKNGDSWERCEGVFSAGIWKYWTQIRIDERSGYGATHVLDASATVKVDGANWDFDGLSISDSYSMAWVTSPEFVIEEPIGAELVFYSQPSFNIAANCVGKAITPYSVAANAEGGTKPYTFSKTSGPDWIAVSAAGMVSGTPAAAGPNDDLVIRVTDSAGDYKEITIFVADTNLALADKTKVTNIVATSNTSSIAIYGSEIRVPTFNITTGNEAHFATANGGWLKKNGDSWERCEGVFSAGIWKYCTQIRIDERSGYGATHVLDASATVKVDGVNWAFEGLSISDSYSMAWVTSPEFVIEETIGDELVFYSQDGELFTVGKILRSEGMSRTAGGTGEPAGLGYDPDNISMTLRASGASTPNDALTALNGATFERAARSAGGGIVFERLTGSISGNTMTLSHTSGDKTVPVMRIRAYVQGGRVYAEFTSLAPGAVKLTLEGKEYLLATPGDVNLDGTMNALDWITIMRWTLVASGGEYTSPNDEGFTIKVNDTDYNLWVLLADMTDTETDNSKNSANWSAAVNAVDWITIMQLTLQAWK